MLKMTAKYKQSNFARIWHFSICDFVCNYGNIGMLILIQMGSFTTFSSGLSQSLISIYYILINAIVFPKKVIKDKNDKIHCQMQVLLLILDLRSFYDLIIYDGWHRIPRSSIVILHRL